MNDLSSNKNSSDTSTKSRKGKASHLTRLIRSSVLALALIGLGAALGFCEEPNFNSGWSSSYDSAVADSHATGKPIMLMFTGSDWCVWCQKLDQDILKQQEFLAWSSSKVAKVEIDFPQNSSLPSEIANQNEALLAKFDQIAGN